VVCLCALWVLTAQATMPVEEPEPEASDQGTVLIDRWQADDARLWLERQLEQEAENPKWRFLLGQALFYLGRYPEALSTLDALIEDIPHPQFQRFREFIAQTIKSTETLTLIESDHFRIMIDTDRDAALVPYVSDILEQSYQRLGTHFGYFPKEKVLVEIFPTTDTFYPASSLSARDIEVSGAIGICKFNKIMLLSPRNLARGYRWTDAISHEYLHYLIVHLSANQAPIWLHEGIAKYFEDAWRLPESAWLSRRTESLLAHALANDSFVGFKNMEPSLVKLETTYQVQLGYAEAASAIDFIIHSVGAKGLARILQDLSEAHGDGATGAISRVMGFEFERFETEWRQVLQSKHLQEHKGVRLPQFTLKNERDQIPAEDLREEIESTTARMHTRLGERLQQRGRDRAAVREYQRALDKDPYSPYLLNKLAHALITDQSWQPAQQYLERARAIAPDYVTTYTNLGRLHVAQKSYEDARFALWEAVQINPFDPLIHQYLAESYRRLGMDDRAKQEQQLLERLQESR
jgi:tetratricopeptide (TPR) repeat protein